MSAMLVGEKSRQPFPHFCCSLVGEGEGENLLGRCKLAADLISHPVSERHGLAGAGPGNDQQVAPLVEHGFLLRRIERIEDRVKEKRLVRFRLFVHCSRRET